MSFNRKPPRLDGPAKRPRTVATDYYESESKRRSTEANNSSDASLSRGTPHPEPDASAYSRRDFSERHNSEDNHFIRPGATSASSPRKSSIQSPTSRPTNSKIVPTGPRSKISPSPLFSEQHSSVMFTSASTASSGAPSHNHWPSPPAPIRTQFSDNDSVRSGSVETTTSQLAPVASTLVRSASNSPRMANAADPRKRVNGPSNLHTSRENSLTIKSPATTTANSENTPRILSDLKIERQKEFKEVTRLTAKLEKVKVGSSEAALTKVEHDLSEATSRLQEVEDEIRRLCGSPVSDNQNKHQPESAIDNHESPVAETSPKNLQVQAEQSEKHEEVAELQQQFANVSEELAREKARSAERDKRIKDHDRQVTEIQQQLKERDRQFTEIQQMLAAQRTSKQDQDREIEQKKVVEKLLADVRMLKTNIQQVPAVQSQHSIIQSDIKTLNLDKDVLFDDIEVLKANCKRNTNEINTLYERHRDDKDLLLGELKHQRDAVKEIHTQEANTKASLAHVNDDLSSINKAIKSLRESPKKADAEEMPDASGRLDALEMFQRSASEAMNALNSDLESLPHQLGTLESSLVDVVKDEVANISTKFKTLVESVEKEKAEALNKFTARADSMANMGVPDEEIKSQLAVCQADIAKLAKWTGISAEDEPSLREMINNVEQDMYGPSDAAEDDESKSGSVVYSLRSCEHALGQLREMVEHKLSDGQQTSNQTQQEFEARFSNLEQDYKNHQAVIKTCFESIEKGMEATNSKLRTGEEKLMALSAYMPDLQKEIHQERAARKDLENRFSFYQEHPDLQSQIEAVKVLFDSLRKEVSASVFSFSQRLNELNLQGVHNTLKHLSDRARVTSTGLQNLEVRYNAITTSSLVQKMLDQVHNLLPAGTDVLSLTKELNEQRSRVRQIGEAVKRLYEINDTNKNGRVSDGRVGDDTTPTQTIDDYKRNAENDHAKAETLENTQNLMVGKLRALQNQLGLDDEALNSEPTLRQVIGDSLTNLRESIEQSSAEQRRQFSGESDATNHKLDKLQEEFNQDHQALMEEQTRLAQRVNFLEEENSKASTISTSDPSRFAKKAHLDEVRESIRKLRDDVDKWNPNAGTTGNESSDDDKPSSQRKSPNAPMMGKHPVHGSQKANHTRQHSSCSSGRARNRKVVADSSDDER